MICRRCKHEMPDGIRYCGHCSYRMNRVEYFFAWSFDKKRLPFTLLVIALIIGLIVGGVMGMLCAAIMSADRRDDNND